jgi:hypothetical protein
MFRELFEKLIDERRWGSSSKDYGSLSPRFVEIGYFEAVRAVEYSVFGKFLWIRIIQLEFSIG